MAEKKNPVKQALIFKSSVKINYTKDIRIENKFTKIVPRELKFLDTTPNTSQISYNLKESNRQIMNSSRMLIYEDCLDEEGETFRSTPPNIQDKNVETPGAPIKSRKEFDKKVLRPKKLVYNDKENDNEDSNKEKQFYYSTPKKSGKKEENGNLHNGKFLNLTVVMAPRKIIPNRDNNSRSVYSTNHQLDMLSTSSRGIPCDGNTLRNQGSRKKNNNETKKLSRFMTAKNNFACNKENNAAQLVKRENNLEEEEESNSELYKNRSVKNDRNREEFKNLSKTGELAHFRI